MRSFYAELWPMAVNFCIKETLKLVTFTWNAIESRAQHGLPSIARYARLLHYNLLFPISKYTIIAITCSPNLKKKRFKLTEISVTFFWKEKLQLGPTSYATG